MRINCRRTAFILSVLALVGCGQKSLDSVTPVDFEGIAQEDLNPGIEVFAGSEAVPDNDLLALAQQKYIGETLGAGAKEFPQGSIMRVENRQRVMYVGASKKIGTYVNYANIYCGFNEQNQAQCKNLDNKEEVSPAKILPLLPYMLNQDLMMYRSGLACNLEFCVFKDSGKFFSQPVGRIQPEMAEFMKRNFEFSKNGAFDSRHGEKKVYEAALIKERQERQILPPDTQQAIESLARFDGVFNEGNPGAYGDDFVLDVGRKFLGRYPLFIAGPDCTEIVKCNKAENFNRVDYEVETAFVGLPFILNADVASSIKNRLSCSAKYCFRDSSSGYVPVGLVQAEMVPWIKKHCSLRFPEGNPDTGEYLCSQDVPYLQ